MLTGLSGARELLPRNHQNDENWIKKALYFSYFLQHTLNDFENNRKMLPMETNQSLLSWKVSQPPSYAH